MKTLVVEDDALVRALIGAVLQARGHEVIACAQGPAAVAACQDGMPALVLLDWMLPGMDGLEVCRRLRALPDGESAVILLVTARNQHGDLRQVLEAGADDYVAKPLDIDLLGVRVEIAERRAVDRQKHLAARRKLATTFAQLERSHEDLLSILGQLRTGTAMTDAEGKVTFLSGSAREMLQIPANDKLNRPWQQTFGLVGEPAAQLAAMSALPAHQRTKVPLHFSAPGRRRAWLDAEVLDDPRGPERKIFLLYDVTEVHTLRRQLDHRGHLDDIVGKSDAIQAVFQVIRDVAPTDATVLIEGETGTGKELVARAIHNASARRQGPFIAVNCAGLTESLIASQLFGHRRGAFTGAISDHKGVFETANGGTLFLDEIGDIPLALQPSLLRVLQEREITRVGDSKPQKVDVRVLAATHRNMAQHVENGTFRADLLYRIRVARIRLPALRDRRGDIPLLTERLLAEVSTATNKAVHEVDSEALRALLDYDWPGNVRELRSAIEFAVIRCKGKVVQLGDLPPELGPSRREVLEGPYHPGDWDAIRQALEQAHGNRSEAAKLLGVSRATFYRHMARLQP